MNDNPLRPDSLIRVQSANDVPWTAEKLIRAAEDRGFTLFARIDHAAGAADAGMDLRPTLLVIFGNPKGGTPLMQCDQQAGLDLPLKVLVWEDEKGDTYLTYDHPRRLGERHSLDICSQQIEGLAGVLATLTAWAANSK